MTYYSNLNASINQIKNVQPVRNKNSPFSRYKVKVPRPEPNKHFSLPIDTLSLSARSQNVGNSYGQSRNSELEQDVNDDQLVDDRFLSFEDQLSIMLKDLGKYE